MEVMQPGVAERSSGRLPATAQGQPAGYVARVASVSHI
jgi:hypothetical protein